MTAAPQKTKLEERAAGTYGRVDAPDPKPTKLAGVGILGGRGELVDIPLLGPAWIHLLPQKQGNQVESEVYIELEALKLTAMGSRITFDGEQAVRTLARAVRDPDDPTHKTPFGTLEQWQSLDYDVVAAAWQCYADVRHRLHPLDTLTLSEDDLRDIRAALEKKSAPLLRYYGVAKLSLYLLTTESQRASSTTSQSSPGESSSESSTPEP
jgi:hypothetical protein